MDSVINGEVAESSPDKQKDAVSALLSSVNKLVEPHLSKEVEINPEAEVAEHNNENLPKAKDAVSPQSNNNSVSDSTSDSFSGLPVPFLKEVAKSRTKENGLLSESCQKEICSLSKDVKCNSPSLEDGVKTVVERSNEINACEMSPSSSKEQSSSKFGDEVESEMKSTNSCEIPCSMSEISTVNFSVQSKKSDTNNKGLELEDTTHLISETECKNVSARISSREPSILSQKEGLNDINSTLTLSGKETQIFSSDVTRVKDHEDIAKSTAKPPLNFSFLPKVCDLESQIKDAGRNSSKEYSHPYNFPLTQPEQPFKHASVHSPSPSIKNTSLVENITNRPMDFNLPNFSYPPDSLKPIECNENNFTNSNPLEKLNEHLNSIGFDKDRIHSYAQMEDIPLTKSSHFLTQKPEHFRSCTKENKDEHIGNSHDRLTGDPSDSFVYTEISKEETGFPDVFTDMVTIGKYISVKGDFTLRSTEALIESPSLVAPYLLKEPDTFPPKEKESKTETKDFFHTAAGELLIGIGLSRVNEWFHRDMTRIKKRQIKREGKLPQLEEELALHENHYAEAKKANSVYSFPFKACKTCGFSTESSIVMEGHLLVPHITARREYQCNFCEVVSRDPKGMLDHMLNIHKKTGRIQPPVLFFECPYCSFESNSKVKLNTHLTKCQRFFDNAINQAPPRDFEYPALTPKPITVAVVKAYEKSLSSMQRGRGRPKKVDTISDSLQHMNQFSSNISHSPLIPNHLPSYRPSATSPLTDNMPIQNQMMPPMQMPGMNLRPAHSSNLSQLGASMPPPPMHMPPPNHFFQVVNSSGQIMPVLGNSHLVTSPSQFPFSSTLVNSGQKKLPTPPSPFFNTLFGSGLHQQTSPKNIPDITITPLPKLQGPYPVPLIKPSTPSGNSSLQSSSLVVCEICDGYIKDLEQLRTHMQLIHKVKIHPKMLISRPPLNCQKCQWRFFTDQGLERHLLGAHGLVTSNMQELANKGKDAGCCTICGRVYASKLVSHMNQVHKITLKPAHLSYKCTVCSATFNLYRLFENHVYLVHSGAAKRAADGSTNASKRLKGPNFEKDSLLSEDNKKEKRTSKSGEENIKRCKECGNDIASGTQTEKCEKCLKSSYELVQGTDTNQTFKEELRKKDRSIDKIAL